MSAPVLARLARWAADQHLATPVHLFCRQSVTDALARLRDQLDARISYAVKANTHPLMLRAVRDVDEYNVTNLAHLQLLLDARTAPDRITYVNPVIDDVTAATVINAGVTRFVIDDERGLNLLVSHRPDLRLTLRLRPSHHDGQAERSLIRFGTTAQDLEHLAVRAVKTGASVEALSFFIGTHSDDLASAAPYRHALQEITTVHTKLAGGGICVPQINIGGGFPGSRRRFYRDHPDFFDRLNDHVHALIPSEVEVICEPGRYLAEASMAILTTVIADRTIGGHRMTHLDASGYSGLFETTFIDQGGASLTIATDRCSETPSATQLLGPIMDSFDIVKRDALLPQFKDGELLLLPNTGTYSFGYAAGCEGVRQPHVVPLPAELDQLISTTWFE